MTDQQVQLFLADLAIIILLARLLGIAAKRLGQPPVLGEIIAGISHRAALTDEAAPPRRPSDLQRSPVVCRLPGEDTGTKVMLSGTPRRGVAEWSSGISESRPIRTRLLIRS